MLELPSNKMTKKQGTLNGFSFSPHYMKLKTTILDFSNRPLEQSSFCLRNSPLKRVPRALDSAIRETSCGKAFLVLSYVLARAVLCFCRSLFRRLWWRFSLLPSEDSGCCDDYYGYDYARNDIDAVVGYCFKEVW